VIEGVRLIRGRLPEIAWEPFTVADFPISDLDCDTYPRGIHHEDEMADAEQEESTVGELEGYAPGNVHEW